MSTIAIGLSHRSAPVELLEAIALGSDGVSKLLTELADSEHVDEALVLATCNRLEVHADVRKFHGGVQDISERLAERTGVDLATLTEHLYVHYEDRAVQHLFAVAAGLDSMVVGEQQILGQLRSALLLAREEKTVGRVMIPLVERALKAGRRAHRETGIDNAGRSLVSVGVDLAQRSFGGSLAARSAVVVGAGSMSSLAATELTARSVGSLVIANRTHDRAQRLAATVAGRAVAIDDLADAIAEADVLVSCTGSVGVVVPESLLDRRKAQLFVLDLALPRDVDPAARSLPGVTVVDLETLGGLLSSEQIAADVDAVRRVVTDEVGRYLARQRAERVAPTVIALRERAQQVVDGEINRLLNRLGDTDEATVREIRTAVERVVDKLLHAPTVRVKELAESPGGDSYAEALRELFALDAAATESVARATVVVETDVAPAGPA